MFYENGAVTHAGRLLEGTLHTAFVLWGAKEFVSPAEYLEPVSLLDIGPIVLRLAGVAPYGGFQGRVPAALEPRGATEEIGPRPIFSVVQNLRFEESVLVGPWRMFYSQMAFTKLSTMSCGIPSRRKTKCSP